MASDGRSEDPTPPAEKQPVQSSALSSALSPEQSPEQSPAQSPALSATAELEAAVASFNRWFATRETSGAAARGPPTAD